MKERRLTTAERGKFKAQIHSALYKNPDIIDLLIGDTSGMKASAIQSEFKKYVKSHLFIEETVEEAKSFIFYDVEVPYIHTNTKTMRIVLYVISHRKIIEDYHKEGYYGNTADILSQMVEDTLLNNEETANSFGIGKLELDSIGIYSSERFTGCRMIFSVPDFRWSIK